MTIFIAISNLFPLSGLFSGEQRISLPLQWGGSESSEGSADGHWHASAVPLSMTSESIASNNSKKHQKSSFFETWTYRIISRPFQVSEILQFIVTTRLSRSVYTALETFTSHVAFGSRQQTSRQMGQPRVIPDLKGKEALGAWRGELGRGWWSGPPLVEWNMDETDEHLQERNTWGFWNAK